MRIPALAVLLGLAAAGCPGHGGGPTGGTTPVIEPTAWHDCRGRAFTPAPAEAWRRVTSPAIIALGPPVHSAQDVLALPGGPRALPARFTYGPVSKDLEGEAVRVWLDDCHDWQKLGDGVTDDQGRVSLAAPANLGPGVYEARFEVLGDQSTTTSFLWVLPAGTHIAVMDLDGTLTTSDLELFHQILDGSYTPAQMLGSVALVQAHATANYVVLYLTVRPYWLAQKTRDWLTGQGYALGPIHFADTTLEVVPTDSGVGEYKRAYLQGLVDAGYLLDLGYGNRETDAYAYQKAGMPADHIWMIDTNVAGTHRVDSDWSARAAEVAASPPVTQPYTR